MVRIDYSVLSYMRNFAENNSRLLTWPVNLSELDLVVQHKSGSKIGHADTLSRHVDTVTLASTLDKESISREQNKDDLR